MQRRLRSACYHHGRSLGSPLPSRRHREKICPSAPLPLGSSPRSLNRPPSLLLRWWRFPFWWRPKRPALVVAQLLSCLPVLQRLPKDSSCAHGVGAAGGRHSFACSARQRVDAAAAPRQEGRHRVVGGTGRPAQALAVLIGGAEGDRHQGSHKSCTSHTDCRRGTGTLPLGSRRCWAAHERTD